MSRHGVSLFSSYLGSEWVFIWFLFDGWMGNDSDLFEFAPLDSQEKAHVSPALFAFFLFFN